MDFNYADFAEEIGLSQEEQDNYHNMKEELQRQINAVIEENQLLRKGNEDLMVALEQLRQKKNDILQIYRSTVRRNERLAAAREEVGVGEQSRPLRSRYSRWDHKYGGSSSSSLAAVDRSDYSSGYSRPSYLSPALYSPQTSSSKNSFSPYSQEGMYLRAMEYARFSSSNPKYNRSDHSCRSYLSRHH